MVKPEQAFAFTNKRIESIAPPKNGRDFYRDERTRGLGLMVMASGHRSFYWLRKVRNWPERRTLGFFPELTVEAARHAADQLNAQLGQWKAAGWRGPSPFERPTRMTLDDLVDRYVEKRVPHLKNPDKAERSVRWIVGKYLARFRQRELDDVRFEDVSALHEKIGEKHKRMANTVVETLRTLYNYAIKTRIWSGENPAKNIEFYEKRPRDRYLTLDEIDRLEQALEDASPDLHDFVIISIWTGVRLMDTLSAQWSDVALDEARWVIPNPKARVKYEVPLLPPAHAVLSARAARRVTDSPYVFPTMRGSNGHVTTVKRGWRALLKRAGLDYPDEPHRRPRIHDLRRTLASHAAQQGVPIQIISKMLGHASSGVTEAAYAKLNLKAVRGPMQSVYAAMRPAESAKQPRLLPAAPKGRKARRG